MKLNEAAWLMEATVVPNRTDEPDAEKFWALVNASDTAARNGIATELMSCDVCGRLQGVERKTRIRGTAFDFNAAENVKLRCGHWLV